MTSPFTTAAMPSITLRFVLLLAERTLAKRRSHQRRRRQQTSK